MIDSMMKTVVAMFLACFAVEASAATARYFRFTPTAYVAVDTYNYNLGISELLLYDDSGNVIEWDENAAASSQVPASTASDTVGIEALCDNKADQKLMFPTAEVQYPWVMVDAGKEVEFSSYGWWTISYNPSWANRVPTGWTFEISSDGETWTTCDTRNSESGFQDKVTGKSELRGPYSLLRTFTVDAGDTYTVLENDPLNGNKLVLYGTLDLNGQSLSLDLLDTRPGAAAPDLLLEDSGICDLTKVKIINGSPTTAQLTVGKMFFGGSITQTVGNINVTLLRDTSWMIGYGRSIAPSKITVDGSAKLKASTLYDMYCFRFKKNRAGNGAPIALSEINLTYRDKPIHEGFYTYLGASPSSSWETGSYGKIMDGNLTTEWRSAADDDDVRVRITSTALSSPVDGYVLSSPTNRLWAPTDWEVYARTDQGWIKVDERRNQLLGGSDDSYIQRKTSVNYGFSYRFRPSVSLGENTELELKNTSASCFNIGGDSISLGKLTGRANINYLSGVELSCADFSGWTGFFQQSVVNPSGWTMGRFLIDSTRDGGAAQHARLKNPAYANISVENATATPASLLVDETWPDSESQPQHGCLADGRGTMGLVKRGDVRRVLEMQDAAYTGDTCVEEGTLEVRGSRTVSYSGPMMARYFRFTPKKYVATDPNGYNMAMAELQLLDENGSVIEWPGEASVSSDSTTHTGYERLLCIIDGVTDQKCIVKTVDIKFPYIMVDAGTPVKFSGYQWYTSYYTPGDTARLPVEWKFEVSADGKLWSLYDEGSGSGWSDDRKDAKSEFRGPYMCSVSEADATHGDQLKPYIPSEFYADVTPRSSRAPALKSRYFRIHFRQTVNGLGGDQKAAAENPADDFGMEMADLILYRNGKVVPWPEKTYVQYITGSVSDGEVMDLFDDDPDTYARFSGVIMPLNIDAGEELTFDSYAIRSSRTGGNLCYRRLPVSWIFTVSTNEGPSKIWIPVESRFVADELDPDPGALQGPWKVGDVQPLLSAGASDSLGDRSKVVISQGAALSINAEYEKFGPLTGAGNLNLHFGATAEANAFEDAVFSGIITGVGTFVSGGEASQTLTGVHQYIGELEVCSGNLVLDNASFLGVTNVVLAGDGVLTGSGTFAGDIVLSFTGGALGGLVVSEGEVTVSGTPSMAAPAGTGSRDHWTRTVIRAKTVSDATRAALSAAEVHDPLDTLPRWIRTVFTETDGYVTCTVSGGPRGTTVIIR